MDDKNTEFLNTISIRAKLLNEMVEDKKSQLESSIENLKRLEGYNVGSKDSATKLDAYLNQQKLELVQLVSQQKMSQEIGTFVEKLLNSVSIVSKNSSMDAERLFYTKQGEMLQLKNDLEKLLSIKNNHDSALLKASKEAEVAEQEKEEASKTIQKTRPDLDPKTKIGKAAMDLKERKKKTIKNDGVGQENVSKKRGRKPKA